MRDQSGHHRRPSGRGLREVAVVPMRARRTREKESNRTRLMLYTGTPMTLGNIGANGVRRGAPDPPPQAQTDDRRRANDIRAGSDAEETCAGRLRARRV